eukprot:jgi/Psemu1/5551/gm1.5551_g
MSSRSLSWFDSPSYCSLLNLQPNTDNTGTRRWTTARRWPAGMLSYAEYFQATASPFGGSAKRNEAYNTIFGYFSHASTPQPLLEQLLNLFEAQAVGALRIFVIDARGEPCLRLVNGIRKYPGPLAQPSPNKDKDKSFGYLDDIEGKAGELVLADTDMLSQTTASRVLSLEHHMAALVPEGTGHSELIRAHKAFFIPFDLVPFLLGKGLSPCQAMEILHPKLNHGGLVGTCAPLFDTLRVAGTAHTVPTGNPMLLQPGPPFQIEPCLTNYMKHKVMYRDLPSLNRPRAPPEDPALTAAVTALTNHQLRLISGDHLGAIVHPALAAALWETRGSQPSPHLPSLGPELGIQAPLITTAALKRFQDGNFHETDPFDRGNHTVGGVGEAALGATVGKHWEEHWCGACALTLGSALGEALGAALPALGVERGDTLGAVPGEALGGATLGAVLGMPLGPHVQEGALGTELGETLGAALK